MAGVTTTENEEFDHLLDIWTEPRSAPETVSLDSIRRFVQAAMISDRVYGNEDPVVIARFGGVVAPPLYPLSAFVRPRHTPDPLDRLAADRDWDVAGGVAGFDLPPLETELSKSLNGGTEARPIRLARVGDTVICQARYLSFAHREGRSGPLLIVKIEARYSDQNGQDLLRTIRTIIRR